MKGTSWYLTGIFAAESQLRYNVFLNQRVRLCGQGGEEETVSSCYILQQSLVLCLFKGILTKRSKFNKKWQYYLKAHKGNAKLNTEVKKARKGLGTFLGDSAAKYSKLLVENAEIIKKVRLKGQLVRPKIDKKDARRIRRKKNTWSFAFAFGVSKIVRTKMRDEKRTKMERNNN